MKSIKIKLESLEDIKYFVNVIGIHNFPVRLSSTQKVVDAKSIMGVFSLDRTEILNLAIYEDNGGSKRIISDLKDYIVK